MITQPHSLTHQLIRAHRNLPDTKLINSCTHTHTHTHTLQTDITLPSRVQFCTICNSYVLSYSYKLTPTARCTFVCTQRSPWGPIQCHDYTAYVHCCYHHHHHDSNDTTVMTIRGSIPGIDMSFLSCPNRPDQMRHSLTPYSVGTVVPSRGQSGRGVMFHSRPATAEGTNEWSYTSTSVTQTETT